MSDDEFQQREAARLAKVWEAKLDRLEAGDFGDWFTDTTQVLVGLDRPRVICGTKIPPNAMAVFKHDGERWVFDSMTTTVTTWKSPGNLADWGKLRPITNGGTGATPVDEMHKFVTLYENIDPTPPKTYKRIDKIAKY